MLDWRVRYEKKSIRLGCDAPGMPRLTVEDGKRLVLHKVLSAPVEDPTDAGLANLLRALGDSVE